MSASEMTKEQAQQLKSSLDKAEPELDRGTDPRQKALALGLEFSKRALAAHDLDELCFILTNDLRTLINFDRALIISHLSKTSEFVGATNQPLLQRKFLFYESVDRLAQQLSSVDKGIFIAKDQSLDHSDIPDNLQHVIIAFMEQTGCSYLLIVPLVHNNKSLFHLILEFHGNAPPDELSILTVLTIAPFFSSALYEKYLESKCPRVIQQLYNPPGAKPAFLELLKLPLIWVPALILFMLIILLMPISHTVGGESEIVPKDKYVAFPKIEGLVDKIFVKEGMQVEKDQVLAVMDKRDVEHDTKSAEHRLDILTREMVLLKREAGQDPSKLAESRLVQLKRLSASEELDYAKWKSQFLEIKAPVSAIVITKDIESFVGKKFRAGEPFCELAVPTDLWATIYVPEDKISFVKIGQEATVYLNSIPGVGYTMKIKEIAPIAQTLPRLGNVYRVQGPFSSAPEYIKVGMKGIGKITTDQTTIYRLIKDRILARWNYLTLYI